MGFYSWFGGLFGGSGGGSGNQRIYSGAARSSARISDELPWSRVPPYGLQIDLGIVRARSKWLTRNNPYAAGVARDLPSLVTGGVGIMPGVDEPVWSAWAADSRQCHVDGRLNLIALQWQIMRAVVTTGEAFIVRRARRTDSGWPLPVQLVVLDADALAYGPTRTPIIRGASITYGIEFDRMGRRAAYHFRIQHPDGWSEDAIRVEARDVVHVYDPIEPEMQRGVPWFTPAIIALSDMGAFNEAALKKADVAAKVTAVTQRIGDLGDGDEYLFADPEAEREQQVQAPFEMALPPGAFAKFPELPRADPIEKYNEQVLQGISSALGMSYETLTGDYRGMPFSAARMSRGEREMRVRGWRNRLLRPAMRQVWEWAREAARVRGLMWPAAGDVEWPEPPAQEIEPEKEGRAAAQQVRAGLTSLSVELRKRGIVPAQHIRQMAEDLRMIREAGLVLDTDPGLVSAQGQAQAVAGGDDNAVEQVVEGEDD